MRSFNLGLSTAAAVSALLCCAPPASAAPAGNGTYTVTVVARNTEQSVVGDGTSQGSEITVAQDLYRDNQLVGRNVANCRIARTVTADNSRDMQCLGTFVLADGDITGQGRITFTQAPTDFDLAITGGTGRYRNASGWIHGHVLNDTDTQLTFYVFR
ncbi:hypothetical protein ABZ865_05075 [Streptomyces sp. NPDC047085]|uniref:allene oxide cyclase barrel-like domain-containing protein n=1 Tax=Streptomyces sp. NPDC047085 TaxID=3155140 RepID=UPI0033FD45F2